MAEADPNQPAPQDSHSGRGENPSAWPRYELDGLTAREIKGKKVILPIWHGVTARDVMKFSPPLADKVALHTSAMTIQQIARALGRELASL